jgi:hypothetical protein
MYRRKVLVTAAAVFAIGVAFAAQPTSLRADWGEGVPWQPSLWVPGTNALMSAHEQTARILTPPQ